MQVVFTREDGIDTGGLRREFFRLFVKGVVDIYCIGDLGNYIFKKSVPALQVYSRSHCRMCLYSYDRMKFKLIGNVIAMSIVHGGSGFPVLNPSFYHYIVSGKYLNTIPDDVSVPVPEVRHCLTMVCDTLHVTLYKCCVN